MTLVELLVSVAVLTVMILAFSTILVQSQRFISLAQASRRSHALAASIVRIVRSDLRRVSQNGFLAITSADDGTPLLMMTTTGIAYSAVGAEMDDANGNPAIASGTGSLICYGLCDNETDANSRILWRAEYILADRALRDTDLDALPWSMTKIQALPREPNQTDPQGSIQDLVDEIKNRHGQLSLAVPPENLDQIEDLWQVLTTGCSGLSITWTDGQVAGEPESPSDQTDLNLNWYGIDARYNGGFWNSQDPEVDDDPTNSGGGYRAVWTQEDQTKWPKAIKIRFTIENKGLPKVQRRDSPLYGRRVMEYEVIENIGE